MAKVVTDDKHYKAIADVIRDKGFGWGNVVLKPAEMPERIDQLAQNQYDEGYAGGLSECAAQHYVETFIGDGGTVFSTKVPFRPDTIHLMSDDPRSWVVKGSIMDVVINVNGFGHYGGVRIVANGAGGAKSNTMNTNTILSRYSQSEDGTVTLQNMGMPSDSLDGVFALGTTYVLVAVKYTEKTDKERVTQFVNSLTGSGTVTLNRVKVEAAFTDDEWALLIATKPDWTFSWI